jgi:menaquinone-dependent protoporphyrinogen oxidase
MTTRVLVAYATKYGATAEIAERIGNELRQFGLEVDVEQADHMTDVTPYTAVVLGSAVYAGMWRKEAVRFLEEHEAALAERMVWFFSSGPTGEGDPLELMHGWRFPEAQQPIADRIKPRDIALFHGDIDMKKLNIAEKLVVRAVKGQGGDFRDWDLISTWAKRVGETIAYSKVEPAPVPA